MNEIKFINIKEKLKNISQKVVESTNERVFIDRINLAIKRLEDENMNILIVGEFSRGKSTFINALLGKPVLPAKVNPTTATINIISGNSKNNMIIDYFDDESISMDLPNEKINKFLIDFVTVENKDCRKIKKVNINIPGKLEEWDCVLVDTPGVNDLDSAREEITFKYLSQADACIVLLDSQQPLSESERRFLNDKILSNDINRIIFVINKIDESDDIPDGPAAKRLKKYVGELIVNTIPKIKQPKVYAVSSKKALKSKYKNEDSSWEKSFNIFEKELVNFISENAANGKLPQHALRIRNILNDMIQYYDDKLSNMSMSTENLKEHFDRLNYEKKMLEFNYNEINILIDKQKHELKNNIARISAEEFTAVKDKLTDEARKLDNMENVVMLKSYVSRQIRQAIEKVCEKIEENKNEFIEEFYEKLNSIYAEDNTQKVSSYIGNKSMIDNRIDCDITFTEGQIIGDEEKKNLLKAVAAGGAVGYVAGALFGPIGVVAGLIGSGVIGFKMGDKIKEENLRKIINDINMQLSKIIYNAESKATEIAHAEAESLSREFKEIIRNRLNIVDISIEAKKKILFDKKEDINSMKDGMMDRITELKEMLDELGDIEEEIKNERNIMYC